VIQWTEDRFGLQIGRSWPQPWCRSFLCLVAWGDRREDSMGYEYRVALEIELVHPWNWFWWEIVWIDQGMGERGYQRIGGIRQMPLQFRLYRRKEEVSQCKSSMAS